MVFSAVLKYAYIAPLIIQYARHASFPQVEANISGSAARKISGLRISPTATQNNDGKIDVGAIDRGRRAQPLLRCIGNHIADRKASASASFCTSRSSSHVLRFRCRWRKFDRSRSRGYAQECQTVGIASQRPAFFTSAEFASFAQPSQGTDPIGLPPESKRLRASFTLSENH